MCFSILCSSYYVFYDISAPVERAPTIRSGYACLPVCQHVAVYAVGYHDHDSNCKKSSKSLDVRIPLLHCSSPSNGDSLSISL